MRSALLACVTVALAAGAQPQGTVAPRHDTAEGPKCPDIQFVGSISQKVYYPVDCAALQSVPETDRVYYTTEDAPKSAGLHRTIVCRVIGSIGH
jgi:hypothetical protein